MLNISGTRGNIRKRKTLLYLIFIWFLYALHINFFVNTLFFMSQALNEAQSNWFLNAHWSNWNSKKEVVELKQFLLMLWICYIQFSQLWFGQVQLKWYTRLNEGHEKEFQFDISCICSYFLEMRLLFSTRKKTIIEVSLQNCHEDVCSELSQRAKIFQPF